MDQAHILLVEDEDDLRMIVEDALSARGFTVTAARNGVEALRYLRQPNAFSHLVTDVSMPEGVSGLDVASEALQRRPDMEVIVVSGYQRSQLPPIPETMVFLPKPYRMNQLLSALELPAA
ncbi:MAG: response regulator [Lysobacter sp.]